jgi:hypothetical protein
MNNRRKPRPNAWITGPDPLRHKQYLVWLQQKNQAQYRKEGWDIDFDRWLEIWGDLWFYRGRGSEDFCMTRLDFDLPLTADNVEVITRLEHLTRHRARQIESRRENLRILKLHKEGKL